MRHRFMPLVLVISLLLGAMLVAACGEEDNGSGSSDDSKPRTVSISGEGRVSLQPDVVMMSLGVTILDANLSGAQSEAAGTMDRVIAALKAEGVAEEDIQTSTYSIYLERDYTKTDAPVTGYRVTHMVTVKARNVDGAGDTLQAAIDAGANSVQNVWFALEDTTAAIRQARELAVNDARDKAAELARLAGEELGNVLTISEGVSAPVTPGYRYDTPAAPDASVPINPGLTEVMVTVSMTWELD